MTPVMTLDNDDNDDNDNDDNGNDNNDNLHLPLINGPPASTCSMLSMGDNPGAFANSLKGICTVFVTSALASASIKLVGLAASETPDPPLKALPLPCHLSISSIGKGPGLNVTIHVCCNKTTLSIFSLSFFPSIRV